MSYASKFYKLILLFVLFSSNIQAQEDDLTLPLAVDIALRTNPLVRATTAGQEIASSQLVVAKAKRMPVVQIGQTFTNSNNPVFVFGTLLEQGEFGTKNFAIDSLNKPSPLTNFRSSISLRIPLFDQLQAATQIAQARLAQKQATAQETLIQQQIRLEVIKTYYGVVVAEAQKRVASDAVETAMADLKRVSDLFEQGLVVGSDLMAMEVQLAEFQQQQIQAVGEVNIAYAALNTALGLPIGTPQKIVGSLSEKLFVVSSQEELIEQAFSNRPDYKQIEMDIEASQEGIRGARGEYLPKVDLFANVGNSGSGLVNGSSDYTVGVSLTINLFDKNRQARIRQAKAVREAANAELQRKADDMRFEVVKSYQRYISAQQRLRVAMGAIKQATETLRIVRDRHEVGLTNITEVLRAQTALVRAQINLLGARYDYYMGYAQIMFVSGNLRDVVSFAN